MDHSTEMLIKYNKKFAIVVHSCDKYEFVWEKWAKCFQGCLVPKNLPVYFLSEEKKNPYIRSGQFIDFRTGPGEWSDRLIRALEIIPEDLIFYMQEDMFPRTLLFDWHFELFKMVLLGMDFAALQVSPDSKHYIFNDIFPNHPMQLREFAQESNYLLSHQPRLWHKDILLKCLIPGESPWINEIEGTKRIREERLSIGFIEWNWYEHMVKKGKWVG